MTMGPRFAAALFGMFLVALPLSESRAAQTRCAGRPGRELIGKFINGVPLVGGIRSGMTRDEARRVAPRLSLGESRQRLELFPGMSFRATAMFQNFFGNVEWVRLYGSWREVPTDALTEHYGNPIVLANSASGADHMTLLKWCDGNRVFLLTEHSDNFSLVIAPEQWPG
jgi:hypothetical protein